MAVFHQPVRFSAERQASIVFVLAAEDQEKHLKILQDILEIISVPENIRLLTSSDNAQQVLLLLRSMLHTETE